MKATSTIGHPGAAIRHPAVLLGAMAAGGNGMAELAPNMAVGMGWDVLGWVGGWDGFGWVGMGWDGMGWGGVE